MEDIKNGQREILEMRNRDSDDPRIWGVKMERSVQIILSYTASSKPTWAI